MADAARSAEGINCANKTLFVDTADPGPITWARSVGQSFIGNVLQVTTETAASTGFNFITATAGTTPVSPPLPRADARGARLTGHQCRARAQMFSLRGDGLLNAISITSNTLAVGTLLSANTLVVAAGETITSGGLRVVAGGVTIAVGGMSVADSSANVLLVYAGSSSYANTVAVIDTNTVSGTGFSLLDVRTQGNSLVRVRGDGRLFVARGGVEVVSGGLTVDVDGATIADGGLSVSSSSKTAPAVLVQATSASFTGTVAEFSASASPSSAFNLVQLSSAGTTMLTVRGDGLTTISQGGLLVATGGATVQAGQLVVDSGVTITSGGLVVEQTGATISVAGLAIDDGGAQVRASARSERGVVCGGLARAHVRAPRGGGGATGANIFQHGSR